jgi:hypothetical protein
LYQACYLVQLRRFGEAGHNINSCVRSILSYVGQIILIQCNCRLRRGHTQSYVIPHLCDSYEPGSVPRGCSDTCPRLQVRIRSSPVKELKYARVLASREN